MKKSILLCVLSVTLCTPALVFAAAVNEQIEDVDLATWVEDYDAGTETLDSVTNIPGPGVRYQVSTTATTGWWKIGISDDYPVAHIYGFGWNSVHPGFAVWTEYSEYSLSIRNNHATGYVYVKAYFATRSVGDWHDCGGVWLAPGQSATRTIDLTGVSYLDEVCNLGFELAAEYGTGSNKATAFDVTVAAQLPRITVQFDPDALIQAYPTSAPGTGDTAATQLNARRLVEPPGGYNTYYSGGDYDYRKYGRWANSLGVGEGIAKFELYLRDGTSPFWGRDVVVNPAGPTPTATQAPGWTSTVTQVTGAPGLQGWVIEWTRTTASYINSVSSIGDFSFTAPLYYDDGDTVYDADDTPVLPGDTVRLVFGSYNTWTGYADSEPHGTYGHDKFTAGDTIIGHNEALIFDASGWAASYYTVPSVEDDYYNGGVAWDKEFVVDPAYNWPWIMAWKAPFGNEAAIAYALNHGADPYFGDVYGVDASGNDTWAYYGDGPDYWWGSAYQGTLDLTAAANILKLDVQGDPVYLQPGQTVTIDMDALNLVQHVFGCQAILNFSSTYFVSTPSGLGSPIVQAGGGIWDELVWGVWNTGGDLDVAVGVDLESVVGTKVDGTVAKFTLTVDPGASDGATQMVFRPDGTEETEKTLFSDSLSQAVYPGSKIPSQNIIIDGTRPDVAVAYPNGGEYLKGGGTCTITWTVTETYPDEDSLVIEYCDGSAAWQPISTGATKVTDLSYVWTVPSLNINNAKVRITVADLAGNTDTDDSDAVFTIDSTNPAVDDIKLMVEPGGTTDLTPSGTAVQGQYKVFAYVSDDDTGFDSGIDWTVLPTISVKDSLGNELTHVGAVQADQANGRFTLVVEVKAATENGTANIKVSGVTDKAGNVAADATDTFEINKNKITGTVELQSLNPPTGGITRTVTFVANGGTKTWDISVNFAAGSPTGSYTLTDVPTGTTALSAKAAWNLRRKLTGLSLDGNGQLTGVNFTGGSRLLGGDINGSNGINILDYSILKTNWFTTNAVADINGDGSVQFLDYSIMKSNFFQKGDAE